MSRLYSRRSIRLKGYDYSLPGAYFVTINTQGRVQLFWEERAGKRILSPLGRIVKRAWLKLPRHHPCVQLGTFCIMPDHVHGIIIIISNDKPAGTGGSVEAMDQSPVEVNPGNRITPTSTEIRPNKMRPYLPEIIRAFKSFSARSINAARHSPGTPVWQRDYYEHIIRNMDEWGRIRNYILANPEKWKKS